MATHYSILAWEIPWTEEPGGLQFIGLQRVRNDWMTEHSKYVCVCICVCILFKTFFHYRLLQDIKHSDIYSKDVFTVIEANYSEC